MKKFIPRGLIKGFLGLLRENRGMLVILTVVVVLFIGLLMFLAPSYRDPASRLYSSSLGYPAMIRKMGLPLKVEVAEVTRGKFNRSLLGEGTCASEPILVSIVPMAIVTEVLVQTGDLVKEGQALARLDPNLAVIKLESAKLAVSTASAELARVKAGSAYVLAQERPEMEKINLEAEEKRAMLARDTVERFRAAFARGVVAKTKLLEAEKTYTDALQSLAEAKLRSKMAGLGVSQSLLIAENAVRDAKEAVAHREAEMNNYEILSPATGLVERVLIRKGEYNQDSGKPGLVVAQGLWFDAYFDQSDFQLVKEGMKAEVRLESYPGRIFEAEVRKVIPVVSFNEGGPEISRPLRPRGSGAPEWAATFKVELVISELTDEVPVAMGMTGFARIKAEREGVSIPRAALVSVSAGSGLVYLVEGGDKWSAREVKVGMLNETQVEILEGLAPGEQVMTAGHWMLRDGDEISVGD
ncbi:MAG: multidrug efflux pump subunit AcrA (membrane-fusion protein) [Akkermansiaceae bacterium]|jgi:multidrug efflux pump subunit AcrA (membrane-fusion protein)